MEHEEKFSLWSGQQEAPVSANSRKHAFCHIKQRYSFFLSQHLPPMGKPDADGRPAPPGRRNGPYGKAADGESPAPPSAKNAAPQPHLQSFLQVRLRGGARLFAPRSAVTAACPWLSGIPFHISYTAPAPLSAGSAPAATATARPAGRSACTCRPDSGRA